MHLRHFVLALVSAALVSGCQQARIDESLTAESSYSGEWNDPTEEVTEDSVSFDQMVRQRAQIELRGGGQFPLSIFQPGDDPASDIGFGAGLKGAFEVAKNVWFGILADFTHHDVEDPGATAGDRQLDVVESYYRTNVLFTADYDMPLWKDKRALILRVGGAAGVTWAKFSERDLGAPGVNSLESFFSFIFRPSVGLRLPVSDKILAISEVSYDFVPERSLQTNESATIIGERPIFSGFGLWLGVAFEWD